MAAQNAQTAALLAAQQEQTAALVAIAGRGSKPDKSNKASE